MKRKRVSTIRELAAIAGVSHMTVSRVFRKHPSVRAETRERILSLAREYDFKPHPILSMAMAIRANLRDLAGAPHATLGWVHRNAREDDWHTLPYLRPYLDGVRERAAALGFGLDRFWIGKGGLNATRFCDILAARGIAGCVVAPPPGNLKHLRLRWQEGVWVTFHHDSWRPLLHRVATDANYNLAMSFRELRRLGYQRIGLAIPENLNAESGFAYQGRFLVARERHPGPACIPPLLYPHAEIVDAASLFQSWVRKHRPDVIMCNDARARTLLEGWGHRVPDDVGLAHLSLGPDTPDWTGMLMDGRQIGSACVDLLLTQIHHNHRGVPRAPYEMLLRSRWVKGETTRNRPAQ